MKKLTTLSAIFFTAYAFTPLCFGLGEPASDSNNASSTQQPLTQASGIETPPSDAAVQHGTSLDEVIRRISAIDFGLAQPLDRTRPLPVNVLQILHEFDKYWENFYSGNMFHRGYTNDHKSFYDQIKQSVRLMHRRISIDANSEPEMFLFDSLHRAGIKCLYLKAVGARDTMEGVIYCARDINGDESWRCWPTSDAVDDHRKFLGDYETRYDAYNLDLGYFLDIVDETLSGKIFNDGEALDPYTINFYRYPSPQSTLSFSNSKPDISISNYINE